MREMRLSVGRLQIRQFHNFPAVAPADDRSVGEPVVGQRDLARHQQPERQGQRRSGSVLHPLTPKPATKSALRRRLLRRVKKGMETKRN